MKFTVKARNAKVTERQREHIEQKLSKLERYFDGLQDATVEVRAEQQRGIGDVHRVQVTLVGDHGVILRAEEQAEELYGAVDQVIDVLQRQITRYKEKHFRRGKLRRRELPPEPVVVADAVPDEEEESNSRALIRTKEFVLRPMFTDDAVEQMELLGHNFFVFQDAETEKVSVIYRRRDGNYGLIVPSA